MGQHYFPVNSSNFTIIVTLNLYRLRRSCSNLQRQDWFECKTSLQVHLICYIYVNLHVCMHVCVCVCVCVCVTLSCFFFLAFLSVLCFSRNPAFKSHPDCNRQPGRQQEPRTSFWKRKLTSSLETTTLNIIIQRVRHSLRPRYNATSLLLPKSNKFKEIKHI